MAARWQPDLREPIATGAYVVRAKDVPGADPTADPELEARLAWVVTVCWACGKPHTFPFRSIWSDPGYITKENTVLCPEKRLRLSLMDRDPVRSKRIWREAEGAREPHLRKLAGLGRQD